MTKSLRCKLGMHAWTTRRTGGRTWKQCRRCHAEQELYDGRSHGGAYPGQGPTG